MKKSRKNKILNKLQQTVEAFDEKLKRLTHSWEIKPIEN